MTRLKVGASLVLIDPSPSHVSWARAHLEIANPERVKKERMGFWVGDCPKAIALYRETPSSLVLPIGASKALFRDFPELKRVPLESDFAPSGRVFLRGGTNTYPYQEKAVTALLRARRGILVAPCGSGKTNIGLELVKRTGYRALWLTHTQKLLKQSEERARALFPEGSFGEITEGKMKIGRDITFATVQTMSKIDPALYAIEFGCVVVDECHHCVGSPTKAMMFYKVVSSCPARYKYGLTATLKRADGLERCAEALLGEVACEITKEDVGARTLVAEHRKVSVPFERDPMTYADFDGRLDFGKMIDTLCGDEGRDEIALKEIEKREREGSAGQIVLTARVAHAKKLAEALRERGISASCVVGSVPERKRDYGAKVLVATYALAKEGLDEPRLDAVHLLTPTRDKTTVLQSAGRCERAIEGKMKPVVYDYVDEGIPYCASAYLTRKRALKKREG